MRKRNDVNEHLFIEDNPRGNGEKEREREREIVLFSEKLLKFFLRWEIEQHQEKKHVGSSSDSRHSIWKNNLTLVRFIISFAEENEQRVFPFKVAIVRLLNSGER